MIYELSKHKIKQGKSEFLTWLKQLSAFTFLLLKTVFDFLVTWTHNIDKVESSAQEYDQESKLV